MTTQLYYTEPQLTKWQTSITSIVQKEDSYLVTLAETNFYPEGGGQPADAGTINGIMVDDVFEESGEVFHTLKQKPEGPEVICEVNWDRRFDHMQQHTGQHLLSATIVELYDWKTAAFHLGKDTCTIDIETSSLNPKQIHKIEEKVNEYIYKNIPLKTYNVTEEELKDLPIPKMPKVTDNIRIVEISGIDYNACCGTHVTRTGEIGLIKILKAEKQKGNTRLFFKCGIRALQDYQASHEVVSKASLKFSSSREDLLDKINKLEEDHKQLLRELHELQEQQLLTKAKAMADSGSSIVIQSFDDKALKELQSLAKHYFTISEGILILTAAEEKRLLFAHNTNLAVQCGKIFKNHLAEFKGKGGGNDTQAQATFEDASDLKAFEQFLQQHVENLQ